MTNVYDKAVIVSNETVNHVSYNGGNGGIAARPTSQQLAAEHERHQAPLAVQAQHQQAAAHNGELFARVTQGRPPIAATVRPADFHAAVPARAAGAPYHAPAISPREARGPATGANRPMTSPSPRDNSRSNSARPNDGFRPFTPPSRGNTPNHNAPNNAPNNNARNNAPNNTPNNTRNNTRNNAPMNSPSNTSNTTRPGNAAPPNDSRPSN